MIFRPHFPGWPPASAALAAHDVAPSGRFANFLDELDVEDIPVARERVMLRGNETGPKATLPERAAAPGPSVDALYVALAQIFHEEGADVRRVRRKKQVHMIGLVIKQ